MKTNGDDVYRTERWLAGPVKCVDICLGFERCWCICFEFTELERIMVPIDWDVTNKPAGQGANGTNKLN